ncbi:MAG: flagellar biosynthetic protein FliR [Rhodocyclaceae bacterium]|nr:flagellar biosynthetic protein FliR [Rhodocyclaceae bacterium]
MLSVTSAQLNFWLAAFFFPLTRILALLATATPFDNAAVPGTIRLVLGLAITFALTAAMPAVPAPAPGSWLGLALLAKEALIGVSLGFAMRLAFTILEVGGELIALQMGLSFATLYDPQSSGQTGVISDLFILLATLMFLSLNGHLAVLNVLAESFRLLPVGAALPVAGWHGLVLTGGSVFGMGLLLALPILAALLITNIALGILTRAAPQLNVFAVGFPVTMLVGFIMLILAMNYLAPSFEHLFDLGFSNMRAWLGRGAG